MTTKYKVTIEEITEVTKPVKGSWTVIGEAPITLEELRGSTQVDVVRDNPILRKVYGYTPDVEATIVESNVIFTQIFDELDVASLVCQCNGKGV